MNDGRARRATDSPGRRRTPPRHRPGLSPADEQLRIPRGAKRIKEEHGIELYRVTTVRFKYPGLAEIAARTLNDRYPDNLHTFTGRTLRTDLPYARATRALFMIKVRP